MPAFDSIRQVMAKRLGIWCMLAAAVAAVYWPVIGFGWVDFDDPAYVSDNPIVARGLTGRGIAWAFSTGHVANWHPFTWLSLMIDSELWGQNPAGFHLTNVVLHALNVLLLLELLWRLTGAAWPSALVAALLAVHPLHVESVAWIAERKDVLSLMFWLLTMHAWVRHVQHVQPARIKADGFRQSAASARRGWYLAAIVFFGLGLMSKPMLVTLPAALLLLDVWPLRRLRLAFAGSEVTRGGQAGHEATLPLRDLIVEKLPLLALAVISAGITVRVQHGSGQLDDGVWQGMFTRLANATVSYARYLYAFIWPSDLAVLYPNPSHIGNESWRAWQVWASAALLGVTTLCLALRGRRWPELLVGWLWFAGVMLPVIGLVQIGRHSMADRYAYIPHIGLYMMVAWALVHAGDVKARLPPSLHTVLRPGLALAAVAWVSVLAAAAHRQVHVWRDSETLWRHALSVTSSNWIAHNNLAAQLAARKDYPGAVAHLAQAVAIAPGASWVRNHHARMLWLAGHRAASLEQYRQVTARDPEYAEAHFNLALALHQSGDRAGAIESLERALRLKPGFAGMYAHVIEQIRTGAPARDPAHPAASNGSGAPRP